MRPDLHAPGPAVLPKLRDVDLAAGWKGGDPKSCDCVIPKNAAILARLAFMRIDRALVMRSFAMGRVTGKQPVSTLAGT
jgi:hypothetical protein